MAKAALVDSEAKVLGGFGGFEDMFGDIFGDIFGGGFGGGSRPRRRGPERGADIRQYC